jgi:hypothetical protein
MHDNKGTACVPTLAEEVPGGAGVEVREELAGSVELHLEHRKQLGIAFSHQSARDGGTQSQSESQSESQNELLTNSLGPRGGREGGREGEGASERASE